MTDGRHPNEPPEQRLRLTYVGHATILIEIDSVRILTDPVLRSRVGPLRRRGPTPVVADLGPIDVVLISHAHPDHFDRASLRALGGAPLVVVPRGLGRTVATLGREPHELDIDGQLEVSGVRITAILAQHGRWPLKRAARPIGYLIEGTRHIYFAGDTALFPKMRQLAGRVDVALLPVGRWGPPSGPERLTPSTAIDAALLTEAKVAIPIHWGTLYVPGFHTGRWGWGSTDAGATFAVEARRVPHLNVVVLQPGERRDIEP